MATKRLTVLSVQVSTLVGTQTIVQRWISPAQIRAGRAGAHDSHPGCRAFGGAAHARRLTFAFSRASIWQAERPIPMPPPVTIATFPSRLISQTSPGAS